MRRSFSRLSNKGDRAGCRNAAGARTSVTGAFRPIPLSGSRTRPRGRGCRRRLDDAQQCGREARARLFQSLKLLGLKSSERTAYIGTHIRFGRGRGNGTALLSITVLCTGCGFEWVEAGAIKAAIGSLDAGFRTPCDLCMEPVSISLSGVFIPLLIFRSPKMLNTKITAAKMLTTVR